MGVKRSDRWFGKFLVKARGLTAEARGILPDLRGKEVLGTNRVAVKCVDTVRNTKSEGRALGAT